MVRSLPPNRKVGGLSPIRGEAFYGISYLCLVHLPGQNIFCPGQYWNCPGQKICPELKSPFFPFKSHWIWIFLIEDKSSRLFQSESFILMPRPSARTKYFLSWTKLKLSKIKILSRVKKYIFCSQKSFKTKFPDWKSIFNNKYSFCMTFESKKCSFKPWTKILSWTILVLSRTKNILSEQKDEA